MTPMGRVLVVLLVVGIVVVTVVFGGLVLYDAVRAAS